MFALHLAYPDVVLVRLPYSFLYDLRTHTHTYMHVLRVMSMSFVKSRIPLPHGQRPHLTVEHLIPHNNIQLHAVKIVPEKQERQIFFTPRRISVTIETPS